jgi:hypothetical protein
MATKTEQAHPAIGDIYRCNCANECGYRYRVTKVTPQDGWTEVTAVRTDRPWVTIVRSPKWFRERVTR